VAVEVVIEAAQGAVRGTADDSGLRLEAERWRFDAPWHAVVGAGLVRARVPDLDAAEPDYPRPPGLTALARTAAGLAATERGLMLAHDTGARRPRAELIWLPADDPGTARLLAELERRLGPRWQAGEWSSDALRRRLGVREPARRRAAGVLSLAFVAVLLWRVRHARSRR
jgi:hypothetical protein